MKSLLLILAMASSAWAEEIKNANLSYPDDPDRAEQVERLTIYADTMKIRAQYPGCDSKKSASCNSMVELSREKQYLGEADLIKIKRGGVVDRVNGTAPEMLVGAKDQLEKHTQYLSQRQSETCRTSSNCSPSYQEYLKKIGPLEKLKASYDKQLESLSPQSQPELAKADGTVAAIRAPKNGLSQLSEIEANRASQLAKDTALKIIKKDAMNLDFYDGDANMAFTKGKECSIAVAPTKFPYRIPDRGATWKVNKYIPAPKVVLRDILDDKGKLVERKGDCRQLPSFGPLQKSIRTECEKAQDGHQAYFQSSAETLQLVSGEGATLKAMWFYAPSDEKLVTCLKNYGFKIRQLHVPDQQMAESFPARQTQ